MHTFQLPIFKILITNNFKFDQKNKLKLLKDMKNYLINAA